MRFIHIGFRFEKYKTFQKPGMHWVYFVKSLECFLSICQNTYEVLPYSRVKTRRTFFSWKFDKADMLVFLIHNLNL